MYHFSRHAVSQLLKGVLEGLFDLEFVEREFVFPQQHPLKTPWKRSSWILTCFVLSVLTVCNNIYFLHIVILFLILKRDLGLPLS